MLIASRIHSACWEGKALLSLFDDNTMQGSLSRQYPFICLGERAFQQVLFAAEVAEAISRGGSAKGSANQEHTYQVQIPHVPEKTAFLLLPSTV